MSTTPPLPQYLPQRMEADRKKFPGMAPREIIIFKNWLGLYQQNYDRFDYNVRLGSGFDPGPDVEDALRKQWIMNTQKRADAVAYKGNQATLIEVKDRFGFSAMGQLLGYFPLYVAAHPSDPKPLMLAVSNRFVGDIVPALTQHGIEINTVGADFGVLRNSVRSS